MEMQRPLMLFIAVASFCALLSQSFDSYAQTQSPSAAPVGLEAKVQHRGTVPVIVKLKMEPAAQALPNTETGVEQRAAAIKTAQESFLGRMAKFNPRAVKRLRYSPYVGMRVDAKTLAALRSDPDVVSVVEDVAYPAQLQQSTQIVGATVAWARGFTGSGQTIAILDTGVDSSHPFLAGKVVSEACYSSTGTNVESVCPNGGTEQIGTGSAVPCNASISGCSHGTHVAGIAAGKGTDFSGVAKDATLIAIQVFSSFTSTADCSGFGLTAPCALSFTSDQMRGLERVYDLRASFSMSSANMSIGGGRFTEPCSDHPLVGIIGQLRSAGIATSVSAGNNGFSDALTAPACVPGVYSVGSVNKSLVISSFSNSAAMLSFLAPGEQILSSVPGGFAYFNGTSMAAPHLAGAWAISKGAAPTATFSDIENALYTGSSTLTITDPRNGLAKPVVQVDKALDILVGPNLAWLPSVLDLLLED